MLYSGIFASASDDTLDTRESTKLPTTTTTTTSYVVGELMHHEVEKVKRVVGDGRSRKLSCFVLS